MNTKIALLALSLCQASFSQEAHKPDTLNILMKCVTDNIDGLLDSGKPLVIRLTFSNPMTTRVEFLGNESVGKGVTINNDIERAKVTRLKFTFKSLDNGPAWNASVLFPLASISLDPSGQVSGQVQLPSTPAPGNYRVSVEVVKEHVPTGRNNIDSILQKEKTINFVTNEMEVSFR